MSNGWRERECVADVVTVVQSNRADFCLSRVIVFQASFVFWADRPMIRAWDSSLSWLMAPSLLLLRIELFGDRDRVPVSSMVHPCLWSFFSPVHFLLLLLLLFSFRIKQERRTAAKQARRGGGTRARMTVRETTTQSTDRRIDR